MTIDMLVSVWLTVQIYIAFRYNLKNFLNQYDDSE